MDTKNTKIKFEHVSSSKRIGSIMRADFRRMFTSRLFYIMVGICLVMPVLILVMTTMSAGSAVTDPQMGVETVVSGFENTWKQLLNILQIVNVYDADINFRNGVS